MKNDGGRVTERGHKIICGLGILGSMVLLGVLVAHLVRRSGDERIVVSAPLTESAREVGRPVKTNPVGEVGRPAPAAATNAVEASRVKGEPVKAKASILPRVPTVSVSTNVPAERQVRLANRTISLEKGRRKFPKKFAELQMPSARGTVAFVVVSELPVSKMVRDRASSCGARVLGFMPVNSLIVEASAKTLRRLEDDAFFAAAYELDPNDKVQKHVREFAAKSSTRVDVTVQPLMATDVELLKAFVKEKGGMVIPATDNRNVLRARVAASVVDELARRGDVRWIERYVPATLQNNVAVKPGLMNVEPVWNTHGLTGRGQFITCADSGLDSGDPETVMEDFQGRIVGIRAVDASTLKNDIFGHGTHVAGSLVGNGALSKGDVRGVAHGARLWVWGCAMENGFLNFPDWSEMFQPAPNECPAYIHSESWGYADNSTYTSQCRSIDAWLWEHPEHLVVFAAGNKGANGERTIVDPSGAKNVLSVGATESLRPDTSNGQYADNAAQIADFSARGPMVDGRIKPDLCAPGTMILSVKSRQADLSRFKLGSYSANSSYVYDSGTSMATPLVAGAAALVREWLVDRRGFTNAIPTAALVKAVLMGGAHDMGQDAGADCGGAAPNNQQGWGRVNVGETLYPSNRSVKCVDAIPFATGYDHVVRLTTTNTAPLDVQLVWIDHPAQSFADSALVNDLDLVVSNETTGVVWLGNGIEGGDRTNNVESVRIAMASPGTYAVHVRGVMVPYDSSEGGAAALYARGAFAGESDEDAGAREMEFVELRRREVFVGCPDDYGQTVTNFLPRGTVVQVEVPFDLPRGSDRLTGLVWTDSHTKQSRELGPQRLGEITVGAKGGGGVPVTDAEGRMARAFRLELEADREIMFRYYDEDYEESVPGLPEWWWRRYLANGVGEGRCSAAADADGDGVSNADEFAADTDPVDPESVFRIVSVSPTNIVWRGGCERTQVVERTESIGASAAWTGIFTNLPPTTREGVFTLPAATSNSFYRIRAF